MGVVGGIVLALAGLSAGDTIELPLTGCSGFYDVNTPAWTMDFDLGVTFSEISHVYIDWSGEISAGLRQGIDDPEPILYQGVLVAGIGAIPGEGWLRRAVVGGGYPHIQIQNHLLMYEVNSGF